ncbi:MAG: polysaccharide deacetylase family protein [Pseudomonadota bacterium]
MSQGQAVAILMYHATYGDTSPLAAVDAADRPYAVSETAFAAHLDALAARGHQFVDASVFTQHAQCEKPVLLSFDDGHQSNAQFVAPVLAERQLPGLFFITTDWTDTRETFCTCSDLRAMVAQGMTLGSHGCSHAFIADLDTARARAELADSKMKLEDILGQAIDSLSFPGGRFGARDLHLAAELGYRWVYGSVFGVHPVGAGGVINRLPVREGMDGEAVSTLCDPSSLGYRRARMSSKLKSKAKRLLGNGVYDAIYRKFAT